MIRIRSSPPQLYRALRLRLRHLKTIARSRLILTGGWVEKMDEEGLFFIFRQRILDVSGGGTERWTTYGGYWQSLERLGQPSG